MLFETLSFIGDKLNKEGILWGVGASILLNHYELVDKPHDIDIIIDIKDIGKADEILKDLGEKKKREQVSGFSTEHFYEYSINGEDVDVMAGMIVNFNGGSYKYIFDEKSVVETKDINGIKIPLTSLEDWYVLYQLMERRENKVMIIEDYLMENGIKRVDLLERALTGELPKAVRERIESLLSN